MRFFTLLVFLFQLSVFCVLAQPAFKVVPLGVKGGVNGDNLSAYMIAPGEAENYICLDAGTLYNGIEKAISKGGFKTSADEVLRKNIKGYLISHAHLDHVSGLVINSVEDTAKNVYSLPRCLEIIKNHYFNWESWPNMGNEGTSPNIKKYLYKYLTPGIETAVENTQMSVTAFPLSHSNPYESAAFLIQNEGNYVLYFGDTGPDEVEKSDRIQKIWEAVAPLLKSQKLKGIFLEVSYPNEQPDGKLYGHLTPSWFMRSMNGLAVLAGNENIKDLKVVVTHMKPTSGFEEKIRKQLQELNSAKVQLIFPEQGVRFDL
jgi:cAMP phosphodiesterase